MADEADAPADLQPGALVAIRGRVLLVDEEEGRAVVTIGTGMGQSVRLSDIVSVLDAEPETVPIKAGDKLRDTAGTEWTAIADPREADDGRLRVALWSDRDGVGWDYPENLTAIEGNDDDRTT